MSLALSPTAERPAAAAAARGVVTPRLLSGISLGVVYGLAAWISTAKEFPGTEIGVLWLPLGVLLGWLVRSPIAQWPELIAWSFLGDIVGESNPFLRFSLPATAQVALLFLEDALQSVLGAWLVRRWAAGRPLTEMRGTLTLVLAGAATPAFLFAFEKAGRRSLYDPSLSFWQEWYAFLLSNVLSVIAVAPLILFVARPSVRAWTLRGTAHMIEAGLLALGFALVGTLAIVSGFQPVVYFIVVAAAPLPFALWAAIRFGPAGVGASALLLTLVGLYGRTGFGGSFSIGSPTENLLATQIFLIILVLSMLFLSAALVERQDALVSAHDSEARYRSVVEHQTEFICRYRPDTTITFVNDAYCRFFGRTQPELLGTRWIDRVPPADHARMLSIVARLSTQGGTFLATHQVLREDGTIAWTQWVDQVIPSEDGSVQELQGIGRDVTDLTRTHDALRRSEERLKRAMEAADLGDWEVDLATGSLWWSESLSQVLGRRPSEFNDLQHAIAEAVFAADRLVIKEQLTGIAEGRNHRLHFRIVRPDGEVRWLDGGGDAVADDQGRPRWLVGVAADATQRRQDEQALREALEEVRRLKDRLQAENTVLLEELSGPARFGGVVYASQAMKDVLARADRVARTETPVLITGETGTGKELVARAIHERSHRQGRALVRVNCAALPESLIESELFGHEKGAFTGAATRRAGRFEVADQGTLFLDEIGELPLELQAKLLRVVQEGEFERLGSSKTVSTDVRLIAATNRDLARAVQEGRFRSDLFYRLNVFPVHMPPLRERPEDVPPLSVHFLDDIARRLGRNFQAIGASTLIALQRYHWPGNVRELQNVLERSALLTVGPVLMLPDGWDVPGGARATAADADAALEQLTSNGGTPSLEALERAYILQVLERTRWRIEGPRGAAVILGLHPSTLRSRLTKLGIVDER
jgi:PAS domain S-box-containing protein